MTGHGKKQNRKQEAAISALLTCGTLSKAAKKTGVSESTLIRWQKDDNFKRAFRLARFDALERTIANIQRATGTALKTLEMIIKDKKASPSARTRAACAILGFAFKGSELLDLVARVEDIENELEKQD